MTDRREGERRKKLFQLIYEMEHKAEALMLSLSEIESKIKIIKRKLDGQ